ncbi:MAG: toll/interleukin-1 receptor domain-containing protein [Silvibacterium sp.]
MPALKRLNVRYNPRSVTTTMAYQYEAFFSYKRDVESDAWHYTVMEKLRYWLRYELNQLDVPVFFDTEEIRTGMRWRNKISQALISSKTIVCLWSPLYFQSEWCVSEWQTFAEREHRYNTELVAPASYHDGSHFPAEARAKQILDFSNYTSTASRFWGTEIAVDFERLCLMPFARDLASLVRMAPQYDPNFPLVEVSQNQLSSPPTIGRIADV